MEKLIAVYGTLRKNEGNHYILGKSEFLGQIKTPPNFTMYDNGGFPFVFPQGTTPITLEIYRVINETDLLRVYRLEGYTGIRGSNRNWYDTVDVQTPFGVAEMFVSKTEKNLPIISSGDWKDV